MQANQRIEPIPALTGLRFFAALFVFISHSFVLLMPLNTMMSDFVYYNFQRLSAIGMSLFFILSGFVIQYNYSYSICNNPSKGLYNFIVSRFARLYPLFITALLLEVFSEYGKYSHETNLPKAMLYYFTMTQSWFYTWLGDHSLIYQFKWVGPASWSISTEWFFYLSYPIIAYVLMKSSRLNLKLAFLLSITVIGFFWVAFVSIYRNEINQFAVTIFGTKADFGIPQDSFNRWLIYFAPFSRILEFIVGCVTAAIFIQLHSIKPEKAEERLGSILLAAAILLLFTFYYFIFYPPGNL